MYQAQKNSSTETETYTRHQVAYFAHALTIHGSAEDNLTRSLASARVDMNPHQVEASLFALRSPLSKGVLLADEVGLGKTIEAGLVIAQKWAERRRKIILIVPAMLRNQWFQELLEKFEIPSIILESSSYRVMKRNGKLNPFDLNESKVVLCSYHFASRRKKDLQLVNWDLVVFDEAHKLRNVWQANGSKMAKNLCEALAGRNKILLSATPLQNSLLELYGLVSIIDPNVFEGIESFRAQYVGADKTAENLETLQDRIAKICYRTLRRQVQKEGGINFTRRHAMVKEFDPFPEETELYERMSEYLRREDIAAFSPAVRHLVTIVIRKILASSSFAIIQTLDKMIERLEGYTAVGQESLDDFETSGELADEMDLEDDEATVDQVQLDEEIEELKSCRNIAQRIKQNAKGEALLPVLDKAFAKVEDLGGQRKAVIFTESRRTQIYLKKLLEENGYQGQLVLLNGSNSDAESRGIFKEWQERQAENDQQLESKTASLKAAIVEEFKNKATILISTESGAEGINLQFCSLLVNYDLPWNPQRVEQRIGRVHRYGQKCDVVVVNFVNKANAADQRVYELLKQKFKLFEGVFGASDEILGSIASAGISIEKRINDILQRCRHADEIEAEFNVLQAEMDSLIRAKERRTRQKLLENFDEDVISRLRDREGKIQAGLNQHCRMIRAFCRGTLPDAHHFEDGFSLNGQSYYYTWAHAEENAGHFLNVDGISQLIEDAKTRHLPSVEIIFDYADYDVQLADLKSLRGQSGWLRLSKLTISSIDTIETLVFNALSSNGVELDQRQCERLMLIPAIQGGTAEINDAVHEKLQQTERVTLSQHFETARHKNEEYFEEEQEKLDRWTEDTRELVKQKLEILEKQIRDEKKIRYKLPTLEERIKQARKIEKLELEYRRQKHHYFDTLEEINKKTGSLLDEIEMKMHLSHEIEEIFTIRWKLI